MPLWLDDLDRWGTRPAIVTQDLVAITYEQLDTRLAELVDQLGAGRQLVLIEAKNELEPLLWYLACLRGGHAVMLVPSDRPDIDGVIEAYGPTVHIAKIAGEWRTDWTGNPAPALHPDLAVLLSTSGSTGAAKFVRLSHDNIAANAASIAEYLELTPDDKAITSLPFHYSYGLSVVNSHLMSGAELILTDHSVVEPAFWDLFGVTGATSLAAVPYTFELLDRVGFDRMELPSLRYVTAAGGRVSPETVVRYAQTARSGGWKLFVMYGQTEATARMAFVPPHLVEQVPAAIGRAIPGGQFELRAEDGTTITEVGRPGELIYRGRNVMMGYATSRADLSAGAQLAELATGDLAQVDADGVYSIVGRKSRFLKIFGLRIGLDEIESRLVAHGYRTVVTGTDDHLAVATLDHGAAETIRTFVCEMTTLPPHVVGVEEYEDYPLLASGKVDYARIRDDASAAIAREVASHQAARFGGSKRGPRSVRDVYADFLRVPQVRPEDTFVGLGGDSLSYIQVEMALESLLGEAPHDWHRTPVSELETRARGEVRARRTRSLEMPVLLRAVAITFVAAGHIGLFYFPGSSATLFAIAGLNFARFQLPAILSQGSPRPALHMLARIVVPTALYTMAITLFYGYSPSVPITFLFSNLVDIDLNDGLSFWFIELLAQLVLVMAVLFAFKRVRRAAAVDPRSFGLGLLAVSLMTRALGPFVWDTDHLINRVPHAALWIFALGWCVYFTRSTRDRLLLTAVSLAIPPLAFDGSTPQIMGMIGLTLLVWIDRVRVPRGVDRVASMVAAASLYIYLTHYEFKAVLEKVGVTTPVVVVATALVGGVIVARVADRATPILLTAISRKARPATTGTDTSPAWADAELLGSR